MREKTNSLFRYSGLSLLEFFSFPQMYFPHLLMGESINSVFGQISCDAEVFCAYASAFFFGVSLLHLPFVLLYFPYKEEMFAVTVVLLVESKTCMPKDGRQFSTTITGFELVSRNLSWN